MDLSVFDVTEDGIEMQVRHPATGAPLWQDSESEKAVTITFTGIDSPQFKKAARANTDRRIRSGFRAKVTAEQMDEEGLEVLVKCTLSWDGMEVDGAVLPFSAANVRMIFTRFPWLRLQAEEFNADRQNFLKPSSKS